MRRSPSPQFGCGCGGLRRCGNTHPRGVWAQELRLVAPRMCATPRRNAPRERRSRRSTAGSGAVDVACRFATRVHPPALRAPTAVAQLHSPVADVSTTLVKQMKDSETLARLHAAILRDDVKEDSNGCIVLPDGVTWPDMSSSVLFIRSFYGPLWNDVLEEGNGAVRGAAILGTPGSESCVPSHVQSLWCAAPMAAVPERSPPAVHHTHLRHCPPPPCSRQIRVWAVRPLPRVKGRSRRHLRRS